MPREDDVFYVRRDAGEVGSEVVAPCERPLIEPSVRPLVLLATPREESQISEDVEQVCPPIPSSDVNLSPTGREYQRLVDDVSSNLDLVNGFEIDDVVHFA